MKLAAAAAAIAFCSLFPDGPIQVCYGRRLSGAAEEQQHEADAVVLVCRPGGVVEEVSRRKYYAADAADGGWEVGSFYGTDSCGACKRCTERAGDHTEECTVYRKKNLDGSLAANEVVSLNCDANQFRGSDIQHLDAGGSTPCANLECAPPTTEEQVKGQAQAQAQQPKKKIVGGKDANTANYPSFASMRGCYYTDAGDDCNANNGSGPKYKWGGCGATLISKRHILTAGHCVTEDLQEMFDLKGFAVGPSEFVETSWKDVSIHPRYDANRVDMPENDAALITLSRDASSTPVYVDTGSIADDLAAGGGYPIYKAVGHGKTTGGYFGQSSKRLLEADLYGLTDDFCTEQYAQNYHTHDGTMLCAGQFDYKQGATSTCNGDSGGPLFSMDVNANSRVAEGVDEPVLVGVTSWGPDACKGGIEQPSVFAKVATMIEWFGPIVCNHEAFEFEEDRPDWCLACNGAAGGCRNNDGQDWCCDVDKATSATTTTTTTTTKKSPDAAEDAKRSGPGWGASAPGSSSTNAPSPAPKKTIETKTFTAAGGDGSPTGYNAECTAERPKKHCNYDSPNKPFCSCGWLVNMSGDKRQGQCSRSKVKSTCPHTCEERCG